MTDYDNLSSKHSSKINKLIYAIAGLSIIGFADAVYLTVSHYRSSISCSSVSGCETVLYSSYSTLFGMPTALLGVIYYLFILILALAYTQGQSKWSLDGLKILPTAGFLFSLWLVYLQLFIINAICIYCMASALSSTVIFALSLWLNQQKPNHLNKQ